MASDSDERSRPSPHARRQRRARTPSIVDPDEARRRGGYRVQEVMQRLGLTSRAMVHDLTYVPGHPGKKGRSRKRGDPDATPLRYAYDVDGGPVRVGKGGAGGGRRWDVDSVENERERRRQRAWDLLRLLGGPREEYLAEIGMVVRYKPRAAQRIGGQRQPPGGVPRREEETGILETLAPTLAGGYCQDTTRAGVAG